MLSAAQDKFSNVLESEMAQEDEGDFPKQAQKFFRVYRLGSVVHVQALEDFAQSKCVLVPSVMTPTQIARKEKKDIKMSRSSFCWIAQQCARTKRKLMF